MVGAPFDPSQQPFGGCVYVFDRVMGQRNSGGGGSFSEGPGLAAGSAVQFDLQGTISHHVPGLIGTPRSRAPGRASGATDGFPRWSFGPRSPPADALLMDGPRLETDCVGCGQWIVFPYHRLGRRVPCPTCGQGLVLDVLPGTTIPATANYLTFREIEHLLAYEPHRAQIAPLLESWFECEVTSSLGGAVNLTNRKGISLDLADVHDKVQADHRLRAQLHRIAHSLWRS